MSPELQRAEILKQQGRYKEALDFFGRALQQDPDNAGLLGDVAYCKLQADRPEEALEDVGRAILLDPESAWLHTLRAIILCNLKRYQEGHDSAEHAIFLDPYHVHAFGARAQLFMAQEKWNLAEESARKGLAIDPEDGWSSNILAHALTLQGKGGESQSQIDTMLARDPEDEYAHVNAGYAALRAGDHKLAEKHFLESLRQNPNFEAARKGLLESFRARSPLYKLHLKIGFARLLPPRARLFALIGLFVFYRLAYNALIETAPALAYVLVFAWVLFLISSFVIRGVGNLIILADSHGRRALLPVEKAEGLLVGGTVIGGIVLLIAAVFSWSFPPTLVGCGLIAVSIPLSQAFNNDHKFGPLFYGGIAAFVAVCVVVAFASIFYPSLDSARAFTVHWGILATVATTWLAMFGAFHE